jgi:hypothetical protein
MGKVSSAPEDAFHFKGGFEDGYGEIIGARTIVFQYPPNRDTQIQDPPALYAELEIQRYLDKNTRTATPPETILLKMAGPDRATGELNSVHVGSYPNGDVEAEPIDNGNALGAEGDTVFAVQDGFQFNDKAKWMLFSQSLVEKGFKPAVLKTTYLPALIGLVAHFKTETRKKFSDKQTTDPTAFIVSEIVKYPYEGKAKAPAKAPAQAKEAAVPAPKQSVDATPVADTDPESIATEVVRLAAKDNAGKTLTDVKQLKLKVLMQIGKRKPEVTQEERKAVQGFVNDVDWLQSVGAAEGLFEIGDDGKVTFA